MRFAYLTGAAVLVGVAGMGVGMAGAQTVDVIFSRAATSPTATVPGAVDLAGNPVSTQVATMLEFWLSPDGSTWLARGTSTQPADQSTVLLKGAGATFSVVMQEGRPFPGAVGSEVMDFVSSSVSYPFNSNNDWAFSLRARGGTASVFNKIVRFTGGTGELRFQMGDPYIGLIDVPANPANDELVGNSTAAVHLLNNGQIGWHDTTVTNIHTSRRPVTAYDRVKHLQVFVDSVTTLGGGGTVPISNIASTGTLNVLWRSPDGTRTVVRGAIDADGNNSSLGDPSVVIVDGQVRVQEGQLIPGTTVTPTAINNIYVAANNDWYVRGADAGGVWATRNGAVIARTGGSIGSDNWGSTFYTIAGNTAGDWAIAGKSSNINPATDDVIVVNGEVVLREGDAVEIDLDGNGTMEQAFVGRGNNTLAAFVANNALGLAPDGTVYVLANLRDANGLDLAPTGAGVALLRIAPAGGGCPADADGNGQIEPSDVATFVNTWFSSLTGGTLDGDFDHNGAVEPADVAAFVSAWFLALTGGC